MNIQLSYHDNHFVMWVYTIENILVIADCIFYFIKMFITEKLHNYIHVYPCVRISILKTVSVTCYIFCNTNQVEMLCYLLKHISDRLIHIRLYPQGWYHMFTSLWSVSLLIFSLFTVKIMYILCTLYLCCVTYYIINDTTFLLTEC